MALLYSLSEIRTPFLDTLALLFTSLAEETTVIIVICAVYWCINKRVGVVLAVSYFISGLLIQGLKITFRISRPWTLDPGFEPVPEALETATGYSFPSGHTQSGTALFGTLGFLSRRKSVLALCCCAFFLIGLSRMYLGVHTPLDVFTSMALTLLISGLVCVTLGRRDDVKLSPVALGVFAIFAAGLAVYAIVLRGAGTIAPEYALDCLKASGAGLGFAVGVFIEERYVRFDTSTTKLWMQPLKLALGLAGVVALRFAFKSAFGQNAAASFLCYLVLSLWMIALYPLIFKKLLRQQAE